MKKPAAKSPKGKKGKTSEEEGPERLLFYRRGEFVALRADDGMTAIG